MEGVDRLTVMHTGHAPQMMLYHLQMMLHSPIREIKQSQRTVNLSWEEDIYYYHKTKL